MVQPLTIPSDSRFQRAIDRLGWAFATLFTIFTLVGGYWFIFAPVSPPDIPLYPNAQNVHKKSNYTGPSATNGAALLITFETTDNAANVEQFYDEILLRGGWSKFSGCGDYNPLSYSLHGFYLDLATEYTISGTTLVKIKILEAQKCSGGI